MCKYTKEQSIAYFLGSDATSSESIKHGQNLANILASPQVTDEQIAVSRDRIEKLLEYSDKEYVPNALFAEFRALLSAPPAAKPTTAFQAHLDRSSGIVKGWLTWKKAALTDNSTPLVYSNGVAAASQEAKPVAAIHIGWDYLDDRRLVATYAVPVQQGTTVAPKLYPAPPSENNSNPLAVDMTDRIRDAIAENLSDAYVCSRVWSAWQVGTMSQDDFHPASECDDLLNDIGFAVCNAIAAAPQERSPAKD